MPGLTLPPIDFTEQRHAGRISDDEIDKMEQLSTDSVDVFESLIRQDDNGIMKRPTDLEFDERITELKSQGVRGLVDMGQIRGEQDLLTISKSISDNVAGGSMSFLKSALGMKEGGFATIASAISTADMRDKIKEKAPDLSNAEIDFLFRKMQTDVRDEQLLRLTKLSDDADKSTRLIEGVDLSAFDVAGGVANLGLGVTAMRGGLGALSIAGGAVQGSKKAQQALRVASSLGDTFGVKFIETAVKSKAAATIAKETSGNYADAVFQGFKNDTDIGSEMAGNMIASGALTAAAKVAKGLSKLTSGFDPHIIDKMFSRGEEGIAARKQLRNTKAIAKSTDEAVMDIKDSLESARNVSFDEEAAVLIAANAPAQLTTKQISKGFEKLMTDSRLEHTDILKQHELALAMVQKKGAPKSIPVQKRIVDRLQSILSKSPEGEVDLKAKGAMELLEITGNKIVAMTRQNGIKVPVGTTIRELNNAHLTTGQLEQVRKMLNQNLTASPSPAIRQEVGKINKSIVDRLTRAEIVGFRKVGKGPVVTGNQEIVKQASATRAFINLRKKLQSSKVSKVTPEDLEAIASLKNTDFRGTLENLDEAVGTLSNGEVGGFLELATRVGAASHMATGGFLRGGISVGGGSRAAGAAAGTSSNIITNMIVSSFLVGSPRFVRKAAKILSIQEDVFAALPFVTKVQVMTMLQESDLLGDILSRDTVVEGRRESKRKDRQGKVDAVGRIRERIRASGDEKLTKGGRRELTRQRKESNTKKLREALKRRQNR